MRYNVRRHVIRCALTRDTLDVDSVRVFHKAIKRQCGRETRVERDFGSVKRKNEPELEREVDKKKSQRENLES